MGTLGFEGGVGGSTAGPSMRDKGGGSMPSQQGGCSMF